MSFSHIQNFSLRNDVLINLGTFLSRRWSGNNKATILLIEDEPPTTNLEKNTISMPSLRYYNGTEFQKYRQWRVSLWYESMRLSLSTKVLSNDHAFGFILNSIEMKRIEILGLREWKGMENEIIFNEGISWLSRPLLNSLYGKHKIVEAFSQYLITGYIKGELFGSESDRVQNAVNIARELIDESIKKDFRTEWIDRQIPKIIKTLQIDSLFTIPFVTLRSKIGLSMTERILLKEVEKVIKMRNKLTEKSSDDIVAGTQLLKEYESLVKESKKTDNKGYSTMEQFGLEIPDSVDIDESIIYDNDLITKLKSVIRSWKRGWREVHDITGDEIDVESVIESQPKPFLLDFKNTIDTKIALLLDHSSSIDEYELEYKKATIALCEALKFLNVKFSAYAFSTKNKKVTCWVIKHPDVKWTSMNARNLVQIKASGGTPLAEIYNLLLPLMKTYKPDLMITLTDGEPSDYNAVRSTIQTYKMNGIHMVAVGVGKTVNNAINIGLNLKYLEYERTLVVSKLDEIPKRVLSLLQV
ncbi:MAG TPA: vWA domain-containing protein [Nitrososphaeraceae archaeon]|nr:vWA domain-containing protein [Nitrososphaeraceae archaeon]